MTHFPAADEFANKYAEHRPQVVWTELVADLETPVSAMLKLASGQRYSFLLESVEGGAVRGRYSVLGFDPDLIWRCFGERAEIARVGTGEQGDFDACDEASLVALSSLIAASQIELPDGVPPSAVGLFGYMSYDMVRLMERLPDANPDVIGIPDAIFIRPRVTAVFDNVADKITVVTPVWPEAGVDGEAAYAAAGARLDSIIAGLDRSVPGGPVASAAEPELAEPVSNTTRTAYHGMVERAKEYIRAGDIFQVVPSQRFSLPLNAPPMALYRALRRLNPSPFLFIVNMDGFSLVGSSPEILVRLRDDTVTVRPIAGTRPRGATAAEDAALADELLADPKEQAEHLMLLDLGRNDVGRVADIGTVEVTEEFNVERYSHVMHIVSNVQGRLKPALTGLEALVAGFPAGTVSGAPKIRAMEIIDELESERRSFYAGAVGYFGANGDMDTCIALRTALVRDGTMYVQAGGGVVADSDPEAEYQESRNKAKALLRAAAEAQRYANTSG
jgi:anthranilate synthase component 1